MEKRHLKELIRRYKDRTLSREELAVYHQLLSEGKLDEPLLEEMDLDIPVPPARPEKLSVRPRRIFVPFAAAVMVLTLVGWSIWGYDHWFVQDSSDAGTIDVAAGPPSDSIPVMYLASGKSIRLDSVSQEKNSAFAYDGDENLLIYSVSENESAAQKRQPDQYHIVQTPQGKNYKIQLEDGTVVWLNAASSIRFPVYFGTQQRSVEITGEVYFEIAHEQNRPFRVQVGGQTIEVLGTKFNVNSYPDESGITTTLIEGKVSLSAGSQNYLMHPNDQAILTASRHFEVRKVDAKSVIAWTNGFLQFRNESLERILKKVSRWYSVQLELDSKMASERYSLRFNQLGSLEDLVAILNEAGVPSKIEAGYLKVGKKL